MARVELNIVALGDFSSVNNQIKALQAQIATLNKSVAGVGISASLNKDLNLISNAFNNALTSSGNFTQQQVKLTTETQKFGKALEEGKLALGDYYNIIRNRSSNAVTQVKSLALEQTKLQNSIISADPTKQGFYSVFTPTKINAVANATRIAANEQNIYNIAVNKGSQALINWGKNTQWAGRQLTVGMSVPLMLFGSQATKVFQDVNAEIVRLQKVYGTGLTQPTQEALAQIKQQTLGLARELASTMGVSVKDTAAMAADLAATGKTGTDLIVATREAMRLSKLGELDTQAAMKATVSLQNVYKLSTQDLSGAVNFLNAVENQTSTSLQDLVDGIPRVGPIVQQLGGSFKDTAVMMVAMKEAGVPAAQSANAIKSAIASLINPTKAAKDAFAGYNIDVAKIATNEKGNPVKMIMALQGALKGLAPLAQAQLIEKLFGKFQESRIQALITNLGAANSQTKTAFDLMNANNSQLAGVAAAEMKTATESATGKFKRAVETMKADIIPVGEKILDLGTKLLNFGNAVAKVFQGLPGPVKTVMGALALGVALAGPIIMLTGLVGNFVGYLMKGVFNLKQLATGGKTLGKLFTPEIIAAQNATKAFSSGILDDVTSIELLSASIKDLTISLEGMIRTMNTGTGMNGLIATVGSVAQTEARVYSQMHIPGFAKGTSGIASSDTIPALLSPGEAVIPADKAARYQPFIRSMIQGTLPGFKRGNTDVNLGHAASNISEDSDAGIEFFGSNPGLKLLNKLFPGSVKILSKLVGPMDPTVNKQMGKKGGARTEDFLSSFDAAGPMRYAEGASHGGMSKEQMSDPRMQASMADFDKKVRERIVALNKAKITDEDYNKVVKNLILEFREDLNPAAKLLGNSLHNAANTVGGYRTSFKSAGTSTPQAIASLREQGLASDVPGSTYISMAGSNIAQNKKSISRGTTSVTDVSGPAMYNVDSATKRFIAQERASLQIVKEHMMQDGKSVAQFFADGYEIGMASATPAVMAAAAKLAALAPKEMMMVLEMASPSKWAIRIGKWLGIGLADGIRSEVPTVELAGTVLANAAQGPLMENGAFIKNQGFVRNLKGKFTNSEGKMNMQTKAGVASALMMAGPMMSGMLPQGGVAQSTLSNVSTFGGMGMMFGPEGAAIGAGVGLLVTSFKAASDSIRQESNYIKGSFAISSEAAAAFGVNFRSLGAYDFSKVGSSIADHAKSINDNKAAVDSLTQAYMSATDQITKDYLNKIKKQSGKELLTSMNESYASDITAGLSSKQAMQDITSKMIAAGKKTGDIKYVQGNLTTPSNINEAFSNLVKYAVDHSSKGSQALNRNDPKYQNAQANVQYYKDQISTEQSNARTYSYAWNDKQKTTSAKRIAGYQKELQSNIDILNPKSSTGILSGETVDKLTTQLTSLSLGPIKNLNEAFKAMNGNVVNNKKTFDGLAASFTKTWPGFDTYAAKLAAAGGKTPQLAKSIALLTSGLVKQEIVIAAMGKKGKGGIDDLYNQWQGKIDALNKATGNDGSGGGLGGGGGGGTFTGTAAEKATKKILEARVKSENTILKGLKDQLSIQQKQTAEAKRQMDYKLQIADLETQSKVALQTGNYLQAAMLKQNIAAVGMDFNAQTKEQKMQDTIDKIQTRTDTFSQALADLNDAIANGIKTIDKSITAATKLPELAGGKGGMGTVTVNNHITMHGIDSKTAATAGASVGHHTTLALKKNNISNKVSHKGRGD